MERLESHRLVHLDLKGAPPRLGYLEKFFSFAKRIGATGLLIEWEDTFPYHGELADIGGLSEAACAMEAPYSIEEAQQILSLAKENGLIVIPLVQTFGHLEFVLKHVQWRSLREIWEYPSSMCPSHPKAMGLVCEMVRQMIEFHGHLEYIHIGADEVWHLGCCQACIMEMERNGRGKEGLYLGHVSKVARYIHENYPGIKVIIWDDLLRNSDPMLLNDYKLGTLVEPMVWHYNAQDTFKLGPGLWEKYKSVFGNVWGASAFKGATGSCQIVPILMHHVSNHVAWLSELEQNRQKMMNFKGIVFTGWSRFDHYATLCELLPSGIPSLNICMKTWIEGAHKQQLHNSILEQLGYEGTKINIAGPGREFLVPKLVFPGWEVCAALDGVAAIRITFKSLSNSDQIQTWFNPWQLANNYTNPMQFESILRDVTGLLENLSILQEFLEAHLGALYYPHTIEELLGTLVRPMRASMERLKGDCENQKKMGCGVLGKAVYAPSVWAQS